MMIKHALFTKDKKTCNAKIKIFLTLRDYRYKPFMHLETEEHIEYICLST